MNWDLVATIAAGVVVGVIALCLLPWLLMAAIVVAGYAGRVFHVLVTLAFAAAFPTLLGFMAWATAAEGRDDSSLLLWAVFLVVTVFCADRFVGYWKRELRR